MAVRYEKQFPVVCTQEMKDKILDYSREHRVSQSEVVRLAVEAYFGMDTRPKAPSEA